MKSDKGMALEEDIYDDDEDTQRDKYLSFRIGSEDFAMEIANVTEIVGIQKITEVPEVPAYVRGVINLRGRVIPVIDVRLRFKMKERSYDDRTCVVVVNIEDTIAGLIVDTVNEVLTIPETQISLPAAIKRGVESNYIRGMGKSGDSVKILLDVRKMLDSSALAAAESAA